MSEREVDAPARVQDEVAAYEREASRIVWDGPRYRMNVRVLGEGPSVVIVPGIASTFRSYALVARRLAADFQTIVYDYPGENPEDGAILGSITHADLVDDLLGLLDFLGLPQAHPFGLSFGTTVALSALYKAPERFPRAALQGAFSHRGLTLAERVALAVGRKLPGSAHRLPLHRTVLSLFSRDQFGAAPPDRWTFYLDQNGLTSIAGLAHRVDLLSRLDLRPILPEIGSEVLLIHGDKDSIVPMTRFEELKTGLPNASSILLPGVGHQPHFTHPELLADLVRSYLRDSEVMDRTGPNGSEPRRW